MNLRVIGGQFKGRILKSPKQADTRPTQGMIREAVFNVCQNIIEGARFLDLFAGTGAMGLEAISRGANHATFIENNRKAGAILQENIKSLQVELHSTLILSDAKKALERLKEPFDIVYVDPPYAISANPFVENLLFHKLLKPKGLLFIEEKCRSSSLIHPEFSSLTFIKTRRFGETVIHQYSLSHIVGKEEKIR